MQEQKFALNEEDIDILNEIGNIGAGNAATALADILNGRIDMAVPKTILMKFNDIASIFGGPDNLVAGILIAISGSIDGYIMFILEDKYATSLLDLVMLDSEKRDTCLQISDIDQSALKEITNMISGSYISAIAGLTNFDINMSIPYLAIDMAGAVLSLPITTYGEIGDSLLLMETEFFNDDDKIIGHFLLVPNLESYDKLLTALRIGE